jgi:hypothetical protein
MVVCLEPGIDCIGLTRVIGISFPALRGLAKIFEFSSFPGSDFLKIAATTPANDFIPGANDPALPAHDAPSAARHLIPGRNDLIRAENDVISAKNDIIRRENDIRAQGNDPIPGTAATIPLPSVLWCSRPCRSSDAVL